MAWVQRRTRRVASPEVEARKARVKQLVEAVSGMSEEERQAYIDRVGVVARIGAEGRRLLSVPNMVMALHQREGVTLVGGYRQWERMGRQVRKGEQSIKIFAPRAVKKTVEAEGESVEVGGVRFVLISVFDVSQTDVAGSGVNEMAE